MKPTNAIPRAQQPLIPTPYRCDRCLTVQVGYLDLTDGTERYIGFYYMEKQPELARLRQYFDAPLQRHWRDPFAGTEGDDIIYESRLEYCVCADCMHKDPSFIKRYGVQAAQPTS